MKKKLNIFAIILAIGFSTGLYSMEVVPTSVEETKEELTKEIVNTIIERAIERVLNGIMISKPLATIEEVSERILEGAGFPNLTNEEGPILTREERLFLCILSLNKGLSKKESFAAVLKMLKKDFELSDLTEINSEEIQDKIYRHELYKTLITPQNIREFNEHMQQKYHQPRFPAKFSREQKERLLQQEHRRRLAEVKKKEADRREVLRKFRGQSVSAEQMQSGERRLPASASMFTLPITEHLSEETSGDASPELENI